MNRKKTNNNCDIPFVEPDKPKYDKSIKSIAEGIMDGTTKKYKELSSLYNTVKAVTDKEVKR